MPFDRCPIKYYNTYERSVSGRGESPHWRYSPRPDEDAKTTHAMQAAKRAEMQAAMQAAKQAAMQAAKQAAMQAAKQAVMRAEKQAAMRVQGRTRATKLMSAEWVRIPYQRLKSGWKKHELLFIVFCGALNYL